MLSSPAPDQASIIKVTRLWLFSIIVVLSGLAGLGYQIIWSQLLAVSLGHEIIAVLAVIAAFFFGLSLGALCLNRLVLNSNKPQNNYAWLEILIAIWSVILVFITPYYNQFIPSLIGLTPHPIWHWLIAFVSSMLLFLPATFAMGATLPLMEKIVYQHHSQSNYISGLYALNTLGAVIGTLITAYFLVPKLGLSKSAYLFSAVNVVCALGTLLLFRQVQSTIHNQSSPNSNSILPLSKNKLLITLFFTGLLGLGYEVLVIRVLSQILENTVYTFAIILSVYLLGIVSGAALHQLNWAHTKNNNEQWRQHFSYLLIATACFCLLGIASLWLANELYVDLKQLLFRKENSFFIAEFCIGLLIFFLPTMAMGALFSHLAQQTTRVLGLGKALFFNTFGAMLAPLIFGVILLPLIGTKFSLILTALGYLFLLPKLTKKSAFIAATPLLLTISLLLAFPTELRFISMELNSQVVDYDEGIMASVAVIKDSSGHKHLKVNNHFTMGGTASRYSDYRQTHLPLLLHGEPESALYLGVGTGVTLQAAKFYPELQTTAVELIPEILDTLHHFNVNPEDSSWQQKPNLYAADARRFVLANNQLYDVIIAEIFHPSRDGAGSLYTLEHFSLIKNRLKPKGVFCQWLPLFQLDIPTLKIIIHTFLQVFPDAQLHLGHFSLKQPILCLLGSKDKSLYKNNWLLERVHHQPLQQQLVKLRLNSDFALFGGLLAGANALHEFVSSEPTNTDNLPLVTYLAPNFVYKQQKTPGARLEILLQSLDISNPEELFISDNQTDDFLNELKQYWQARDLFLKAGVTINADDDVRIISEKTQTDLLMSVAISSNFTPAYRSLLGLAQGLYQVDKQASYVLLSKLIKADPQQNLAAQIRQQLFGR